MSYQIKSLVYGGYPKILRLSLSVHIFSIKISHLLVVSK